MSISETERQKKLARSVIKNAIREFHFGRYGLADVDATKAYSLWVEHLATAIVDELIIP